MHPLCISHSGEAGRCVGIGLWPETHHVWSPHGPRGSRGPPWCPLLLSSSFWGEEPSAVPSSRCLHTPGRGPHRAQPCSSLIIRGESISQFPSANKSIPWLPKSSPDLIIFLLQIFSLTRPLRTYKECCIPRGRLPSRCVSCHSLYLPPSQQESGESLPEK